MEHKAGLNGTVDDITALRAMKNRKVIFVRFDIGQVIVPAVSQKPSFPPILLKNSKLEEAENIFLNKRKLKPS